MSTKSENSTNHTQSLQHKAQHESPKSNHSSFRRNTLLALGGLFALGGSLFHVIQYASRSKSESTKIGLVVGDYLAKTQAENAALTQRTHEASQNRTSYEKECKDMALIVVQLADKFKQKSPEQIIDRASLLYKKKQKGNPKADIILEDMQAIKHNFMGTTKNLRNIMTYYHTSPEIAFSNRLTDSAVVRDRIYRYETKVRQYLLKEYNIMQKSMLQSTK